jgi:hypothetical protein
MGFACCRWVPECQAAMPQHRRLAAQLQVPVEAGLSRLEPGNFGALIRPNHSSALREFLPILRARPRMTMAAPLASRSPTCLSCLRRLAQPFASNNGSVSASAVSLVQVRLKSNRLRPKDQGVVVRLLDDIPKFGRKGTACLPLMGLRRSPPAN